MKTDIAENPKGTLSKEKFREMITQAEEKMCQTEGAYVGTDSEVICPLKHSFGDGCYVREIFMPAGTFIISKLHNKNHPYFVLKGKALVKTEEGIVTIEAPFQGMTKAGTKRALYILEDMTWITVHVTDETDLDKIENEIISKNFKEFDKTQIGGTPCHG